MFPSGPQLRSCRFQLCSSHRAIVRSASPNFHSTGAEVSITVFRSLTTTAFATIERSRLPTCRLQLHTNPISGSVRFLATTLRFGFEASRGVIHTRNPFSVPLFSATVPVCGLHSPSGLATLRIKAFNRSLHRKPAAAAVRFSCRPVLTVLQPLSRAAAKFVSDRFGNRSVNPGTDLIMRLFLFSVNGLFARFPQLLLLLQNQASAGDLQ